MKIAKNKTLAITIAILLVLSMTASLMLVPTGAHTPAWQIPTYAYINVAPDPAGLGQTVTVGFWISMTPPTAAGAVGDRWHNLKVTVTRPDGTTETLGPFTSDDTGGTYTLYTPTQLGNYTFVFSFPGETLLGLNGASQTNEAIGDYFMPSTSAPAILTVQQEAVQSIPSNSWPTSYWTRPINAENTNWYMIGGNWLGLGTAGGGTTGMYNITGNYNPYTFAPDTAHILWTLPETFGGMIGGEFGGSSSNGNFYSTRQYERLFLPIIMSGILYYTVNPGSTQTPTGWAAVDLKTGKTLWTNNAANNGGGSPEQTALTSRGIVTLLKCGQLLDMVNPNQYGALAYLWSTGTPDGINAAAGTTTYNMFDAITGTYILSIVNGTGMTLTEDERGDLIGYYVNSTVPSKPTLNMWNSTQAIFYPNSQYIPGVTVESWSWRPAQTSVIRFERGIVWTKPLATNISGVPFPSTLSINTVNSGVVLMTSMGAYTPYFNSGFQIEAGYDANTGAQLWITNRTLQAFTRDSINKAGYGVYVEVQTAEGKIKGYSMNTGALLWGPVQLTGDNGGIPVPNPYDSIGGYSSVIANGVLYLIGFGGDIWAVNILTGKILWYTNTNTLTGDAGSDSPYGVWPIWVQGGAFGVADGKLYFAEGHEYSPPLFRGAQEVCLNITNGELIWSILGFNVDGPTAISDGVMTAMNAYDNQIYAYGKGPSKTTVTAPQESIELGKSLVISGSVVDISAGSQQDAVAMNFPNGLPCMSDASMTSWMEHVYEQQPFPSNATGVPVSIDVLDSNGNYRNIGTATSDGSGKFTFTWAPDIPGDFTVIATFAGSGSYYPSYDEAFFTVGNAAPTAAPTAIPQSNLATTTDLLMYIAVAAIAIIIAIAIVGFLMLRKHA